MTLTPYHFDQEAGRKDLATMIVLYEYPLSMVDHYGFRRFCNTVQPLFKVVSKNTIKKDIMKIYGLLVIGQAIARICESVAYWSTLPQREQKFVEASHQMGIESTKKLALDYKTRWNST
ncbi:zinc finger BED domain-containing protein DAYSLEEPER-like [Pistacia vera]|uniref:zinc finger BED domain-containing protein DAYSLEEPER-like n=1 Tax=Pistacia vera TaxID=55513 RepID=UPI001263D497|nr:zinc finger BED domain-containing protein DAYSLEEPER-like [Pistacia vera]